MAVKHNTRVYHVCAERPCGLDLSDSSNIKSVYSEGIPSAAAGNL